MERRTYYGSPAAPHFDPCTFVTGLLAPTVTCHRAATAPTEDRGVETRAPGGGTCARFQPERPDWEDLDAAINHGAQGRDARVCPFGGLVPILQDAASGPSERS